MEVEGGEGNKQALSQFLANQGSSESEEGASKKETSTPPTNASQSVGTAAVTISKKPLDTQATSLLNSFLEDQEAHPDPANQVIEELAKEPSKPVSGAPSPKNPPKGKPSQYVSPITGQVGKTSSNRAIAATGASSTSNAATSGYRPVTSLVTPKPTTSIAAKVLAEQVLASAAQSQQVLREEKDKTSRAPATTTTGRPVTQKDQSTKTVPPAPEKTSTKSAAPKTKQPEQTQPKKDKPLETNLVKEDRKGEKEIESISESSKIDAEPEQPVKQSVVHTPAPLKNDPVKMLTNAVRDAANSQRLKDPVNKVLPTSQVMQGSILPKESLGTELEAFLQGQEDFKKKKESRGHHSGHGTPRRKMHGKSSAGRRHDHGHRQGLTFEDERRTSKVFTDDMLEAEIGDLAAKVAIEKSDNPEISTYVPTNPHLPKFEYRRIDNPVVSHSTSYQVVLNQGFMKRYLAPHVAMSNDDRVKDNPMTKRPMINYSAENFNRSRRLRIGGDMEVAFPYEPHIWQTQMLEDIRLRLETGESNLYEGPPGCGKTTTVLMGAIAWLRARQMAGQHLETRIVYVCSSQAAISRTVNLLSGTAYHPMITTLATRADHCVNQQEINPTPFARPHKTFHHLAPACLSSLSNPNSCCSYARPLRMGPKTLPISPYTEIEEVTTSKHCVFYHTRSMLETATVIFAQTEDVLDVNNEVHLSIREKLKHPIIIFDDAQYISSHLGESASNLQLTFEFLSAVVKELTKMKEHISKMVHPSYNINLHIDLRLESIIHATTNFALAIENKIRQEGRNQCWPGSEIFFLIEQSFLRARVDYPSFPDGLKNSSEVLIREITTVINTIYEVLEIVYIKQKFSCLIGDTLRWVHFLLRVRELYMDFKAPGPNGNPKPPFSAEISHYALHIAAMPYEAKTDGKGLNQSAVLTLLCMSPTVTLTHMTKSLNPHSILFASNSSSPFEFTMTHFMIPMPNMYRIPKSEVYDSAHKLLKGLDAVPAEKTPGRVSKSKLVEPEQDGVAPDPNSAWNINSLWADGKIHGWVCGIQGTVADTKDILWSKGSWGSEPNGLIIITDKSKLAEVGKHIRDMEQEVNTRVSQLQTGEQSQKTGSTFLIEGQDQDRIVAQTWKTSKDRSRVLVCSYQGKLLSELKIKRGTLSGVVLVGAPIINELDSRIRAKQNYYNGMGEQFAEIIMTGKNGQTLTQPCPTFDNWKLVSNSALIAGALSIATRNQNDFVSVFFIDDKITEVLKSGIVRPWLKKYMMLYSSIADAVKSWQLQEKLKIEAQDMPQRDAKPTNKNSDRYAREASIKKGGRHPSTPRRKNSRFAEPVSSQRKNMASPNLKGGLQSNRLSRHESPSESGVDSSRPLGLEKTGYMNRGKLKNLPEIVLALEQTAPVEIKLGPSFTQLETEDYLDWRDRKRRREAEELAQKQEREKQKQSFYGTQNIDMLKSQTQTNYIITKGTPVKSSKEGKSGVTVEVKVAEKARASTAVEEASVGIQSLEKEPWFQNFKGIVNPGSQSDRKKTREEEVSRPAEKRREGEQLGKRRTEDVEGEKSRKETERSQWERSRKYSPERSGGQRGGRDLRDRAPRRDTVQLPTELLSSESESEPPKKVPRKQNVSVESDESASEILREFEDRLHSRGGKTKGGRAAGRRRSSSSSESSERGQTSRTRHQTSVRVDKEKERGRSRHQTHKYESSSDEESLKIQKRIESLEQQFESSCSEVIERFLKERDTLHKQIESLKRKAKH